jgi:cation:H+ antiporter
VSGSFKPRSPLSVLWTAPSILAASMLIAWAAESAQFFIAQGVALAILAWLQTLPEFAVEAVLAWKQEVLLLLANLTGALRLLTGLGWPMIYAVSAYYYRRNTGKRMGEIRLAEEHCVEVVGLFAALAWMFVVWVKASLTVVDAGVLIAVYGVYLWVLRHMPTAGEEDVDELERIPRAIVTAPRKWRILAITSLFAAGGALIYMTAEPFLGSLLAVSAVLGVPNFVFVQWVAPFVSEFPEKVSAFYWARTVERASMALMNMVSSNINQWTLLTAMLPIVYSMSRGTPSVIPLDGRQELELLLTLGQSLLSAIFLMNMRLAWWEAAGLFGLWIVQFAFTTTVHDVVMAIYFVWAAVEIGRTVMRRERAPAFRLFAEMWRKHVR